MGIGRYMGEYRRHDYDCNIICHGIIITMIFPLWWWCMN